MSTGIFEISSEAALKLAFQRSTGESGSESSSYDLSCTWHEKEIIEFVTRVGFLSNKLSCEEMAKQFLCLHEVLFTYINQCFTVVWQPFLWASLLSPQQGMLCTHYGLPRIDHKTMVCYVVHGQT